MHAACASRRDIFEDDFTTALRPLVAQGTLRGAKRKRVAVSAALRVLTWTHTPSSVIHHLVLPRSLQAVHP
eukprot:10931486-Alexandrium_andersonii.AAC.1